MQHVVGMRLTQRSQQRTAHRDRVHHRQRTLLQSLLQRDPRDEGHHQVDLIVLGAVIEQGCEHPIPDSRKDVGLVFKPHSRRRGER